MGARAWLKRNEVFFTTGSAFILSLAAVLFSSIQACTAIKQTELTRLQTNIVQQQLELLDAEYAFARNSDWQRLVDAMWDIYDLFPRHGTELLDKLSNESQSLLFTKITAILITQTNNPVLIANHDSLLHWRSAMYTSKQCTQTLAKTASLSTPYFASYNGLSIIKDIDYVWQSIGLHKNEKSTINGKKVYLSE